MKGLSQNCDEWFPVKQGAGCHHVTSAIQWEPWAAPKPAEDWKICVKRAHIGLFGAELVFFFFNKPTLLAWGGEAEHPEKDLIAQWAGQGSPAHERSCPGPWLPDCEIKERDELLPSVNVFRTGHQSNTAPQKLPLLDCMCPYSPALWQNQRIGEVGKDH